MGVGTILWTSSLAACAADSCSRAGSRTTLRCCYWTSPRVGLDPQIRTELWSLIDSLRTKGTTILMSTHYIEEAERLADEVALMAHGKIISRGKPSDLVAQHAGRETAEVYAQPARLAEVRAAAEAAGLKVRPAGPAIAIVGAEKATNGVVPPEAIRRAASLEDVFVLLTGEEAE